MLFFGFSPGTFDKEQQDDPDDGGNVMIGWLLILLGLELLGVGGLLFWYLL